MSGFKGQVSLIDVLLLGFFISIVLVMGLYTGQSYIQSQVTREETAYAENVLITMMKYRPEKFGSMDNSGGLSVSEALNLYFCTDRISKADMNTALKPLLDRLVKEDYNYIFYTYFNGSTGVKDLKVWNTQSTVCALYLPLKNIELAPMCNTDTYYPPTIGIWPKWKKLPENCTNTGAEFGE